MTNETMIAALDSLARYTAQAEARGAAVVVESLTNRGWGMFHVYWTDIMTSGRIFPCYAEAMAAAQADADVAGHAVSVCDMHSEECVIVRPVTAARRAEP